MNGHDSPAPRVKVISLRAVPPHETETEIPRAKEALWRLAEWAVITNSLQPSSALRVAVLRAFGATIGSRVIIRPRTRIRFPWNLAVGDDTWIGEGVWISNRAQVTIDSDVVVSQETFITTGSHAAATDMRVVASPVHLHSGVWLTARCLVLGGVELGRSALVTPGTIVAESVPAGSVYGTAKATVLRPRFPDEGR